jgi:hypothetical protein
MTNGRLVAIGLTALLMLASACSRARQGESGLKEAPGVLPGSPDCYKTAGASACPPDPSDPSGRNLPKVGALCTLPVCKTCGSPTAPAYRDFNGAARSGWCICVEKSESKGVGTYSCGPTSWAAADR